MAFGERFIPTRVGNTHPGIYGHYIIAVHPHACGEHLCPGRPIDPKNGSSPRVWGTPVERWRVIFCWRFIPTRVGNTLLLSGNRSFIAVHPHACGEHHQNRNHYQTLRGSSPRVWGTLQHLTLTTVRTRFIPTRVGNTRNTILPRRWCTVHPHACGEH